MSLIADALKAAQQEKLSRSEQAPSPRATRYLSLRQSNRKTGIDKSMIVGSAALGTVLLIGTIVAVKMASGPSVPTVRELPNKIVQPPQAPDPAPAATVDSTAVAPIPADTASAVITPSRPDARAVASEEQSDDTEATVIDKSVPRVTSRPAPPPPLTITMESPKGGTSSNAFQLGVAAQNRGDLTAAKQFYMQALASSPNNAEIYNNLGEVYRFSGDVTKAEDSYQEAIRLNPNFGQAWNNLGLLYRSSGRRQEAITAMQKAIKLDPSNAATRANLATQYFEAKLFADAKRLLEEAIQLNPGLAEAHYTLGQTLEAQGDVIGAIKSYNSFLGLVGNRYGSVKDQVRIHLAQLEAQLGGGSGSGGKTNAQ